jgi:hypothetical protein
MAEWMIQTPKVVSKGVPMFEDSTIDFLFPCPFFLSLKGKEKHHYKVMI